MPTFGQLMVVLLKDLENIVREFLMPSEEQVAFNHSRVMEEIIMTVRYVVPGDGFAPGLWGIETYDFLHSIFG